MTRRSTLEEIFESWRAEPLPRPPSAPTLEGSMRVASALAQVARHRRRQRVLRRAAAALAVAAGVLAIGVSFTGQGPVARWLSPAAVTAEVSVQMTGSGVEVTDAEGKALDDAPRLAEGYGLRTLQGSAKLGFPSGAEARVARRSTLTLTATRSTEALYLEQGRVDVEVPKLDRERGFSVETPDAKVVVHGTGFSVSVGPEETRPRTEVSVSHGIVAVHHAGGVSLLHAGDTWPHDEAPSAGSEDHEHEHEHVAGTDPAEGAQLDDGASLGRSSEKKKPRRRVRAPTARQSRELAEQNGHFAQAMVLKNQGRSEAALAELQHLLSSHPSSPLKQEARVERLRILRSLGRIADAQREARRYLRAFPDGYAAQEARELLEEEP